MRQLFLPACVCLGVTWSGATNPEARFTLDEFTGKSLAQSGLLNTTSVAHASVAPAATLEITGSGHQASRAEAREQRPSADIKIPNQTETAIVATEPAPAQAASLAPSLAPEPPAADLLSNLDIEFPVPSGVVVSNGIPIGVPLPPIAKPVVARSTAEICDTLTKSAQINDLPAPFFIRLLFQESRFNPGVISSAGAQGIAQFMPGTATGMGLDNPFDPAQAIPASARLLSTLVRQFGNLGLAAAAYNAGPKRIQDWLGSKGKGKLPEETQGYVKIITGKSVENWTAAQARHPGEKLPRRAPCQESAGLLAWNGPDAVPMPMPSPLRAAPEKQQDKQQDKPVLVAAVVRSDMMHADRAERELAAARSVPKPAAIKIAAKQAAAAKAARLAGDKTAKASLAKSAAKPAAKSEKSEKSEKIALR